MVTLMFLPYAPPLILLLILFSSISFRSVPALILYEHINIPTPLGYVNQCLFFNAPEIQIRQSVANLHVVELHVIQP